MTSQSKSRFYIASLDGIRAIAVMLVLVAHAGFARVVPGGFGVTVFFFLSGYLITSLLRREYERTSRIHLGRFWLRRFFRIIPPMYIVLGLAILAGVTGFLAADIRWKPVAAQLVNMTNYYSILIGEQHFPPGTEIFWSLSVEEHYYLIYPPVLLLLLRRCSYRKIAAGLVAVSVAVLVWRCVLVFVLGVDRGYTFEATDTRIDSILLGCLLGLWRNPYMDEDYQPGRPRATAGVAVGFALLAITFIFRGREFSESVRYTLRSVALIPLFYAAVRYHHWPLFRWLEWPVMRWGGRLSYTIYLIHPLMIITCQTYISGNRFIVLPVAFVMTILFALAMYFLVERHFARLRRRWHYQPMTRQTAS